MRGIARGPTTSALAIVVFALVAVPTVAVLERGASAPNGGTPTTSRTLQPHAPTAPVVSRPSAPVRPPNDLARTWDPTLAQLPRAIHESVLNGGARGTAEAPDSDIVAIPYSSAASLARAAASGYDGITSWGVLEGFAVDSPNATSIATSSSASANFGCVLTLNSSIGASFTLDGTPSNASVGDAAAYLFYLESPGAEPTGLSVLVNDGTATEWYSITGFDCADYLPGYEALIPSAGVLDSPAALAQANLAGGTAYLDTHRRAVEEWEILPGDQVADVIGDQLSAYPPVWYIIYESEFLCGGTPGTHGSAFLAEVDALTGAVLLNETGTCGATYDLGFSETGLPSGTAWSVEVGNATVTEGYDTTTATTLDLVESNGSLDYSIFNVPGYLPTPSSGIVDVNGANLSISITFTAAVTYDVNFTEVGLPSGADWAVRVGAPVLYTDSPTATFYEPAGSYSYAAAYVPEFEVSPANGSISVVSPVATSIVYTALPQYPVQYVASGLPASASWVVVLEGGFSDVSAGSTYLLENVTTAGTIGFEAPNGSYFFEVGGPAGSSISPSAGEIVVNGTGNTTNVVFSPTEVYSVDFNENGLAAGTPWYAAVDDELLNSSGASSLDFELANGSYTFSAGGVPGRIPSPASGGFTVNGHPVAESISFATSIAPETYPVTFEESGLPTGRSWSVSFNGSTNNTTSSSLAFDVPNGSYLFSIPTVAGFTASPSSGSIQVEGAANSTEIRFSAVGIETYSVGFAESDLPPGTIWSVTFAGTSNRSTGPVVWFTAPNGTYNYTVGTIVGYSASPSSGSLAVQGSTAEISIAFRSIGPESYQVRFNQSGLTGGTSWSITLAGSTLLSTTASLLFTESNGTFAYTVGVVPGYTANRSSGSVQVSGGDQIVEIRFNANGSSSGSSSGGFLGLPGDTGYLVVGGAAIAVVVGVLIGVHSYAPAGAGGIAGGAAARRARRRTQRGRPPGSGTSWQPALGSPVGPPGGLATSPVPPPVRPSGGAPPVPTEGAPPTPVPSPSTASSPSTGSVAAFCPECGHAYKASQRFCTNCGRTR